MRVSVLGGLEARGKLRSSRESRPWIRGEIGCMAVPGWGLSLTGWTAIASRCDKLEISDVRVPLEVPMTLPALCYPSIPYRAWNRFRSSRFCQVKLSGTVTSLFPAAPSRTARRPSPSRSVAALESGDFFPLREQHIDHLRLERFAKFAPSANRVGEPLERRPSATSDGME